MGDWLRSATDHIPDPNSVLCLCNFANANEEFSLTVSKTSLNTERIAKIGMAALIERTGETYSRLYADQGSLP